MIGAAVRLRMVLKSHSFSLAPSPKITGTRKRFSSVTIFVELHVKPSANTLLDGPSAEAVAFFGDAAERFGDAAAFFGDAAERFGDAAAFFGDDAAAFFGDAAAFFGDAAVPL